DSIDINGLRQCFHDPDVRIRHDFEYSKGKYPRIEEISIGGGFLDGMELSLHEGLNSIIGAKGAGKSLLVEALRFALDQPPTNPDVLADHNGKLEARLESYGIVRVTLCDETGKLFDVQRTYDPTEDHPYAGDTGRDIAQMFPVLFLSQNEIIKIAESETE